MSNSTNKKIINKLRAFSLLELSIIILILGIITAAVATSGIVISKIRMANARALTMASPINTIEGASLWLESSLDTSFSEEEAKDGAEISSWHNNLPSDENDASQSDSANKPSYANTINRIHTVKFNGAGEHFVVDGKFLNNSDYTFFFVEKRQSNKVNNYFISDNVNTTNRSLSLGYGSTGKITHQQGLGNSYHGSVGAFAVEGEQPKIIAFIQDSGVGKAIYVNGVLASQSTNTDKLDQITNLKIGENFNGELGEVIAFNRALDTQERTEVEGYLSKKWLLASSTTALTCTDGTISGSQCLTGSCSVDLIGATTYLVSEGSGTLNCNADGYSGSSSYTCSSGNFSAGSTCACASGYTKVNGVCEADCSISNGSITGVTATSANAGSGTLSCAAAGYSGTIPYTCSSRTLTTTGTCSCASGYSMSGGTCKSDCVVSGISGVGNTTVHHGSASLTCDQPGSSGNVSYTCNNGSLRTDGACTSTTCTITSVPGFNNKTGLAYASSPATISSPCQTGFAVSSPAPTYTCLTTGAATIASGACNAITCSISAANGFAAKTGLAYAASATTISSPCQSGYTASTPAPTYTCTTSGAANVTGTCDAVICTIAAANGFNAKTGLAYASEATPISNPCQSGYNPSALAPTYTCTTSGAANVTGTCDAVICTIAAANGFNAKTGLAYASEATPISNPCQTGYNASSPAPIYTCTTSGAANVTGTCNIVTCAVSNVPGLTGTVNYGTVSKDCDSGYTGTIGYTCSASGTFTKTSGSCSTITCTTPAGTGYSAQSNLPYATSGSGTFNCNVVGYTGTKNYTCTSSGVATITGGTCNIVTCNIPNIYLGFTGTVNYGTTNRSCDAGYTGSYDYYCGLNGDFSLQGGSGCTPISCASNTVGLTSVNFGTTSKSCDAGYSGTINYNCATNGAYTYVSGSCTNLCHIPSGVTGMVSGTLLNSGTNTRNCNAYGYSGNFSYTCSGSNLTINSNGCYTSNSPHWNLVTTTGYAWANAYQQNQGDCCNGNTSFSCSSAKYGTLVADFNSSGTNSRSNLIFSSWFNNAGRYGCYCDTPNCTPSCSGGGGSAGRLPVNIWQCSP